MSNLLRNKRFLLFFALVSVIGLLLLRDHLNSPDRVRDQAVYALRLGRAESLYAMASHDEVAKCRLTPDKVKTLFKDAPLHINLHATPRIKMEADFPVDRRTWSYTYPVTAGTGTERIYVSTLYYKNQGWTPLLSGMAQSLYSNHADYAQKCMQLDIPGYVDDYGLFHTWDKP